jgi:3-phosphoglycerate kinase
MSTGTQMILTGGAKASNVFWQVAEQATFLVDSVVVGTVIANKMIAAQTRVSVQGRLFSVIEQVTMDSNAITYPSA